VVPATVLAVANPWGDACTGGGSGSTVCQTTGSDDPIAGPNGIIVKVTQILAVVAGITSIVFLVWGGFKYIKSNGDSSAVASAKSTIMAALIGLILSALAAPIVSFVVGKV
jgi:hypothetical protein